MLDYLRNNKRYWLPPIIVFLAALLYIAYKAARTPGSPFEYSLH